MNNTLTIRKYKSGKYYSTEHKIYLNMKALFSLFKNEDRDIKILCIESGKNITNIEIPKISNGLKINVNDNKDLFI